MRVIIAGGRDFGNRSTPQGVTDKTWYHECLWRVANAMEKLNGDGECAPDWRGWTVLCGKARGADTLGCRFAEQRNIPVETWAADWESYGRSAGFIRNELMAKNADMLVAFWDGQSRGTKHMIDLALKHGLEVHVYRYEPRTETDEETF